MARVLAIPDLHLPAEHPKALEFVKGVAKEFKPDKIVFLGDIFDLHRASFHEHDPQMPSLYDEMQMCMDRIKPWVKAFPKAMVCESNHDSRILRMSNKAGIPANCIKDVKEIFGLPKTWEFADKFVIDGVRYTHGMDCKGGAGGHYASATKHRQSQVYGHHHCHRSSTKALVLGRGFIPLKDIKVGETVLGYKDGKLVESKVLDQYVGSYTGDMLKFNGHLCRQFVTDEHRFFGKDGTYLPVKEFIKTQKPSNLVLDAEGINRPGVDLSDNEIRFLVAVAADGAYNRVYNRAQGGRYCSGLRFHFKLERKIQRLQKITNDLVGDPMKFVENKTGSFKSIVVNQDLVDLAHKWLPNKCFEKWILDLSDHQRGVFIDELKFWDGSDVSKACATKESYQFSSSKKDEFELVLQVLTLHGYFPKVNIRLNSIKHPKRNDNYIATFNSNNSSSNNSKTIEKAIKIDYIPVVDEEVACLTTETSNFVILTNDNSVELSGNSFAGVVWSATESDLLFGFNVGCMIDVNHLAMRYGKWFPNKPVLGCGVIIDGFNPIFLPLDLGSKIKRKK